MVEEVMSRFWRTKFAKHIAGAGIELLEASKSLSVNSLIDGAISYLEEKRKPQERPKKVKIR